MPNTPFSQAASSGSDDGGSPHPGRMAQHGHRQTAVDRDDAGPVHHALAAQLAAQRRQVELAQQHYRPVRARVARLDDLGTPYETPEDTAGDLEWTAGDRAPAVHFWLEGEIDQTVRLWTGAWETSVDSAQHRVLQGLQAIAAAHAEQIEADLRARCPDPWLHSVAGAVGRMFRCCEIVNDTFPLGRSLTARTRTHVLCTQVLYAQFEAAPWRAEVATELAGVAITPDAWRTCTRECPAMGADAVLEAVHATLPAWARALEPARLAHCARTLPAGSLVAGGSRDDEDARYPGQRFDYTGHVRLRPAYCDAQAMIEGTAHRALEALPASPRAWRALEDHHEPAHDHGAGA